MTAYLGDGDVLIELDFLLQLEDLRVEEFSNIFLLFKHLEDHVLHFESKGLIFFIFGVLLPQQIGEVDDECGEVILLDARQHILRLLLFVDGRNGFADGDLGDLAKQLLFLQHAH